MNASYTHWCVDRRQRIDQVIGQLQPAIIKNVFVNGVAKELPCYQNYDADFVTGSGACASSRS